MNQSLIWSIAYIVALFAIFYFLFIRPQKKKDKELKEMRDSLAVGDTVVTIGGIVANVAKNRRRNNSYRIWTKQN